MTEDSVKLELMGDRKVKYAALSYCWGPDGPETRAHITLRTNVEKREKGFNLNGLPRTLRDAVLATRSLGIGYIWIDGLCIVQDCDAEWEKESTKMMHYYGNAYLTIVPVMSDSVATGMRHDQGNEPFHVKFRCPWSTNSGSDLDVVLAVEGSRYDEDCLSESAWRRRGWTYQEMLVSSRILFVFDYSMTLRCRMGSWGSLRGWESRKYPATCFLPANDVVRDWNEGIPGLVQGSYREWSRLVTDFTKRKLSKARDRWVAFSGIAEKYCKSFNKQIVAGLWKDRLLEELVTWTPLDTTPLWTSDIIPSDERFPSWSWIGKDWSSDDWGLLLGSMYVDALQKHQPRAEIESIVNEHDFRSAKLQLAGYLLDEESFLAFLCCMPWNPYNTKVRFWFDHCHCRPPHPIRGWCSKDYDPRTIIPSLTPAVSALLIGINIAARPGSLVEWHFLLIQPTGNGPPTTSTTSTSALQEYRRIGAMKTEDGDMNAIYSFTRDQLLKSRKRSILLV